MTATQRWRELVETEHGQSDLKRGEIPPPQDHWRPFAQNFRADPHRTDDPLVNRLLQEVEPQHTVMDVGAGGGRLALPLALRCAKMVAVEPSSSMCQVLREQATDSGVDNVSLVEAQWEEAQVEAVDIILCAHVLYVVAGIEDFVRKMEASAREKVLIVLFQSPPQSQIYPLWQMVHGEERIPLPSLPQFREVLEQLGVDANVEMLEQLPQRGFEDREQALDQLTDRLYLAPGSSQLAKLEQILPDILQETDSGFIVKGSQTLQPALVSWRPQAN